jgi:hypothetical protein
MSIFLTVIYLLLHSTGLIVAAVALTICVSQILFIGEIRKKLTAAISFIVIRIIFEFIPYGFCSIFTDMPFHLMGNNLQIRLFLVSTSVLLFVIFYAFIKLFNKKRQVNVLDYISSSIIYSMIPMVNLFVLYYILYLDQYSVVRTRESALLYILATIGLIISSIVPYFAHYTSNQRVALMQEIKIRNQNEIYSKKLYEMQEENYRNTRKEIHDYRNHLITIESIVQNEDTSIDNYFRDICKNLYLSEEILPAEMNHEVLKVIFYNYHRRCNEQNIDIVYDVRYADVSFISYYDINTIFTNALDNAIEACAQLTLNSPIQPVIRVLIKRVASILYIEIVNTCETSVAHNNPNHGDIHSTKDDVHAVHGYGIQNIQDTVDKYLGHLSIQRDENEFCLSIMIPIDS